MLDTINGPECPEEFGGMVIVADADGVQVNYVRYEDGRLWEIRTRVGADGAAVSKAVGYLPMSAVPDGLGIHREGDYQYAGYWEAAA